MNEAWWRRATVYQIYPKSFNDTTGKGTGDLKGIIQKLDYLKKLGVDVLWLTPIYQSPQNDNGYDISDYFSIYPAYGTMEDFETLLEEAHNRDIKIIMDMVLNHTSTEHEWFKKSASSRDSEYRDFYIWKDPVEGKEPNNWQSKFGGSAWQFDENTGQYYLHLFDVTQADVNWENPRVRKALIDVIRFWAEKGIDGFRLDVVNLVSKDQRFLNDETGDGRKYYTDGPRIHEFLHEINEAAFSPYNMMTVGEMSSTSLENCILYTKPDRKELDMTFQFHHLKVDYPNGEKWTKAPFDFIRLKKILSEWQTGMHEGNGWNALFWCNHDQPRVVSRFGDDGKYHKESAKMLATTLHFMQGTPYIYQGEEIGMTNPNFESIDEYRDVESINAYHILKKDGKNNEEIIDILKQKSRDNSRTPMQWSDEVNAGFTTGTPWINVARNYPEINVEKALQDEDSIFYHYQKLIQCRKDYGIITYGDYRLLLDEDPNIFVYTRQWNEEMLIVVSNFYGEEKEISIPVEKKENAEILISNYKDSPENWQSLKLRPYESIVYYIK
ncbi:alpha,alpha-phosphotrehalase [Bacillus andreraoultii]|uniref:alpha,alpha-phosphotrehalase n=1 Tax=Bacillus andreraoultii TaxID=1499685 RepID=UPI00053A3F1E|nr:alpha,alpha-phosphotrehalase [Bacillus andreraoultii]